MQTFAQIIAAAQAKLATLPAQAKPLRFATPSATMPVHTPTASVAIAKPATHAPRAYRAALRLPYVAPVAMLADARGGRFTINELLACGIAKPAPCQQRNTPMPKAYAIPERRKPFTPTRDGCGPLTSARLIYAGDNERGETLLTIA